nr:unnamed protein product [Spirometra erinaceieuropaei]
MTDFPSGSNNLCAPSQSSWLCVDDFSTLRPKQLSHVQSASEPPSDAESSSSEVNWEMVGDDLMLPISDEHKTYLASIFPGASEFKTEDPSNTAFGGCCAFCSKRLSPDDAALDFYDGRLYCSTCHQNQQAIIPRRILDSWDFSRKPVSFATKTFLDSIVNYPIINLARVNPGLYAAIEELASMRRLRRKLALLWAQLTRCCNQAAQTLATSLGPRAYLLTGLIDIDLFSISDLVAVQTGELAEHLGAAINRFALTHVNSCSACLLETSVCDICDDPSRPIWPHAFVAFRRCATPGCARAMHFDCLIQSRNERTSVAEIFRSINFFDSRASGGGTGSSNYGDTEITPDGLELLPFCGACRRNRKVALYRQSGMSSFSLTTEASVSGRLIS